MKIALKDGEVLIKDASQAQNAVIRSWGRLMKWNRTNQWWSGHESMELLDKLASMVTLPETVEDERQQMHRIQEAVDRERSRPADDVRPAVKYPVSQQMYKHQIRAANMALLTFGIITPEEMEEAENDNQRIL